MGKSATLAQSDTRWLGEEHALIVAWQHPVTRAIAPIGLLGHVNGKYTFVYLKDAPNVTGFRPLLGFPDFAQQYVSEHLFPIFSQRVMSTNRPDYAHYLDLLQLASDASPLRILGRSGGRREGDSLFLVQKPSTESDGSSRAVFFVHGVRHVAGASERITTLRRGDELLLQPMPNNRVNARALLATAKDSSPVGYVPDLLLDYVHNLMTVSDPKLTVRHCNNDDSPPNLRLLVECAGYLPAGYVPFSGAEWAPAVPPA